MGLDTTSSRRPVVRMVGLLAAVALALSSCSAPSGPDEPEGGDAALVPGVFVTLPKPDGASPIADPTVDGRTTTQSYTVAGMSVQDVVDFYEVELANLGWSSVQEPPVVPDGDWHSEWDRGDDRLVVSVSSYQRSGDEPARSRHDGVTGSVRVSASVPRSREV